MKKAEHQRIDAFELWCWRRLLRVPWTARRSNQSILKEISPGISLEGMILKLKLQDFGHLMRRVDSLEKTDAGRDLRAGGEGDDRGWDGWMALPTWWTWVWVNSGNSIFLLYNIASSIFLFSFYVNHCIFYSYSTNIFCGIFHILYLWTSLFFMFFSFFEVLAVVFLDGLFFFSATFNSLLNGRYAITISAIIAARPTIIQ